MPAISFWVVVAVFLGYLALIGPVDYFLLRKVLRRMELTWVTFPPVMLAVCIAAYFTAHGLKGETLRVNQVDLVDVDCQSGRLRGTSWATLFSPRAETYDVAFQPRTARLRPEPGAAASHADELVSWFGLPGNGLGGMAPKTANPVAWMQPYEILSRAGPADRGADPGLVNEEPLLPLDRASPARRGGGVDRAERHARRSAGQPARLPAVQLPAGLRPLGLFAGDAAAGRLGCHHCDSRTPRPAVVSLRSRRWRKETRRGLATTTRRASILRKSPAR